MLNFILSTDEKKYTNKTKVVDICIGKTIQKNFILVGFTN